MRKTLFTCAGLLLAALALFGSSACKEAAPAEKPKYMWIDCEAHFARMSSPDSIRYYTARMKEIGITDLVVDMKSIMGEVLYDSEIAPFMEEFDGFVRTRDYDMMRHFIDIGHEMGMRVHGSLNVFAGGHNFFDRGIIYGEHPEWASMVYMPDGQIVPIYEIKTNYNGMVNPSNPEVREYEKAILVEFAARYPDIDGVIFDRLRYDEITSDFSALSREQFEAWSGIEVENFPEDIIYWEGQQWKPSKHFKEWVEWRATVIKSFVEEVHAAIREVNPTILIGDYTGAWYPTYYQVGVNWASTKYDPAQHYDWATPTYYKTGYADLLDIYMTGLYYTLVTKDEVDNANGTVGQRTEAGMDAGDLTYCYSVEGGAELARAITCGAVPVCGSLYVRQYGQDGEQFARAVRQAVADNEGGIMIFDLVHIIESDWWDLLDEALNGGEKHDK